MTMRRSAAVRPAGSRSGRKALLGASVLVVIAGGCMNSLSNNGTTADGAAASPVQHPTLENVPVPSGFALVDDHTFGSSSGRTRFVMYEFIGPSARSVVNRFYKEYMPGGGWTLKREDFYRGQHTLRYFSDSEECTILIRPQGRSTIIAVNIVPLSKGSAEREIRPPTRRP